MANKPNPKSRKRYLGKSKSTPMPGSSGEPGNRERRTSPDSSQGARKSVEPAARAELAISMDDYPHGRGGMNRVSMPAAAVPQIATPDRPGVSIGPKPPVTKMP